MVKINKRTSSQTYLAGMKLGVPLLCMLIALLFNVTLTSASRVSMRTYLTRSPGSYKNEVQNSEFNNIPISAIEEERMEEEKSANVTKAFGDDEGHIPAPASLLDITPRVRSVASRRCKNILNTIDPCDSDIEDASDDESSSEDEHVNTELENDEHEHDTDVEEDESKDYDQEDKSDEEDSESDDVNDDGNGSDHEDPSFLEYVGYDQMEYETGNRPVSRGAIAKRVLANKLDKYGNAIKKASLKGIKTAVLGARKGGRAIKNTVEHGAQALSRHAMSTSDKARKQTRKAIDKLHSGINKTRNSLKRGSEYVKRLSENTAHHLGRSVLPSRQRTRHAIKYIQTQ